MPLFFYLPHLAALTSLLIAGASLVRPRRTVATWCFCVGMAAFGVDSLFTGAALHVTELGEADQWLTRGLIVKSLVPVVWLAFSLTYSRGDYRDALKRWRVPLVLTGVLPVAMALSFQTRLLEAVPLERFDNVARLQFGSPARLLNVVLLVAMVPILMNLEQTFRSAVGTMRWRIKFVVLGLAAIFGARLYVRSQAILFWAPDITQWSIESGGLLIGCTFLAVAYARTGLAEIDVYPSAAVLRSSLTVLLVGAYLLIVGALAQIAGRLGGAGSVQFQAFVVLLGVSGLALLLLSDRGRQRMHVFVARHFRKAQHDSVRVWTEFSQRLASVTDQATLSTVSAKLIAETFDVLSVTIWLLDEDTGRFAAAASTARPVARSGSAGGDGASAKVVAGLQPQSAPFDLENVNDAWAVEFRSFNSSEFPNGGDRWCVPLRAGDRILGAVVLADRVNAATFTIEEVALLQCIGDQVTSLLLNLRLTAEVARAHQLEAFRTMSAFFVHDLKNTAASLNLMLKNLPVHFDDPEFRHDALRGIGNTARRIDEMITRLSALRQRPELMAVETDLNQLVSETLDRFDPTADVRLEKALQPLPKVAVDREKIQSVVTNLVLNARAALGSGGRIEVRTEHRDGRVLLAVEDNGCGMSQDFVSQSLFRPFQSTKKQGLGIGLFQCRAIVQAHGGGIHVESELGQGTTFTVSLPVGER